MNPKKELSPGVIIGAIVGLLAIVVFAIFFAVKSDPASQPPHDLPRYDPSAKAAEHQGGTGSARRAVTPGASGP